MKPRVRLGRGVTLDLASGDRVVFDGTASGDVRVLSHAHADHQVSRNAGPVVCSPLTAALVETRQNTTIEVADPPPNVDLLNAGHVAGSRAALVTDPDTGRRYLYTGDVCPRERFYLEGFDPPDADVDVLILETTYGTPDYRLPPTGEVLDEIHDWLADTRGRIAVMYGYSLGRAQKLQRIAADADRGRVFVTDTVADVNAVIEAHLDVTFDVERFGDGTGATDESDPQPGDVLVAPAGAARGSAVGGLLDREHVVTAGFSGWAIDRSFRFRRGYDAGFPLSDHADFDELVEIVRSVDPERVYTHHGFAEEFARHLTTEHGYETRALKRNQATLADF
ncbi:MAG: MBL fold metallo-hydrolase RNA specificity domain-containing protein [Halobacteriales archaeon]